MAETAVDTLTTFKPESPLDSRLRGNDDCHGFAVVAAYRCCEFRLIRHPRDNGDPVILNLLIQNLPYHLNTNYNQLTD